MPRTGELTFHRRRGWLRHTGRRWSEAPYSLHPDRLLDPRPLDTDPPADDGLRARLVDQVVEDQLLQGAVVQSRTPYRAVVSYRRPVSHGVHGVLTVLTGGVWALVWLVMVIARKDELYALEVDPQGHVWIRAGGTRG